MANIPFEHSPSSSADHSMLKAAAFYLLLAAVSIAIAVPAAIATVGAQ